MQDGSAAPLHLFLPDDQSSEEMADSLLHFYLDSGHMFSVASSLAQPQMASSPLKSGL